MIMYENIFNTVLVCLGYHSKIPQTGWPKEQKFIYSQFWRLEVQNHSASRAGFLWGLSPWLADGLLLAASSHGLFSMCASLVSLCGSKFLLRYKDSSQIGLEPTYMISFNLTSLKALSPNAVTFWQTGD